MTESHYARTKETSPNSEEMKRLERLRELMINASIRIIKIDGKHYEIPLRELHNLANESGLTVSELIKMTEEK